jgi:uncharacterized paraquat-inducible protein A
MGAGLNRPTGQTQSDTIMSGVMYLLLHGMWPLALLVFFASVVVPLLKVFVLMYPLVFGAVVVTTICAAMTFDPRLIWDNLEPSDD